jgi:hypothetical protein
MEERRCAKIEGCGPSTFSNREKTIFSVRRVEDEAFAESVSVMGDHACGVGKKCRFGCENLRSLPLMFATRVEMRILVSL